MEIGTKTTHLKLLQQLTFRKMFYKKPRKMPQLWYLFQIPHKMKLYLSLVTQKLSNYQL
jgi:hypothetical protein